MSIDGFPRSYTGDLRANLSGETPSQGYLNGDARGGMVGSKESYTIAEAANQLIRGEPGWSNALGVSATVTYAFRANAPSSMPDDTGGFSRFNTAQITQAELALSAWSDVARITFVRVGTGTSGEGAYSDQATILLGNYSTGENGASAFGYYPGSTAASSAAGDVWVNITASSNATPNVGNFGGQVLVHELGHAIGIAHPAEYNSSDDASPTYAESAIYYEDSRQYTVMSYFSETNTGASFSGRYSAAPLIDDIAAAQLEYGANMSTRTGDTVYGFNATADRPWFITASSSTKLIFAVWDAGGKDTFDFSGYSNNQKIDLTTGAFSDVGGLVGNVAIAANVVIENATGGSGADTIIGNGVANVIYGGSGADCISGGDGNDFLRGEDGNDLIYGGAGFDDIHGNLGADTEYGGDGNDWVVGGQNNDVLYGQAGNDIVYGNLGDDVVDGDVGDDYLRGGQGNDQLFGVAGNDWLSGDRGDDTITGGAGADTFHVIAECGIDRVTDFNSAEGDRVKFEVAGTPYTLSYSGSNTIIDLGGGNQMILVGVTQSTLGDWLA